MFELSIAYKYLLPKRRQLSVSIISLISICVISLVIWLILVFFSVTRGLEKGWVEKLISLTAPVRVVPTQSYFDSYYYQIDHISSASDYAFRSIGEKIKALNADPYNPRVDEELPVNFAKRDLDENGNQKDLVKLAFSAIESLKGFDGLSASEYEVTGANMRLRLIRGMQGAGSLTQAFLSQAVYIGSLEEGNQSLQKTLLPLSQADLRNMLDLATVSSDEDKHDSPDEIKNLAPGLAIQRKQAMGVRLGLLGAKDPVAYAEALNKLNDATYASKEKAPFYAIYRIQKGDGISYHLPKDPVAGDGVLAPKSFRDAGVMLGDRGYLSYYAPTASSLQEQRLPIFIAGFYDPGIVPLGGKFLLADPELVHAVLTSQQIESSPLSNGINIRFANISQADNLKAALEREFQRLGIARYWKVETYRDFDYAKDLLQQLASEKNIFGLISIVILVVACSNIVSMLIILVNDKRYEIGILRSMGATSFSIAMIFGLCGMVMGLIGSLCGWLLALFTLRHLNDLLGLISSLQGYQAFNPLFYGDKLPNEMSYETLLFVVFSTAMISLIAGLIPAWKASRIKPALILRSE